MSFANPLGLAAGFAIVLCLAVCGIWAARRAKRDLDRFAGPDSPTRLASRLSPRRHWLRLGLRLTGALALALALGRPQWGEREVVVSSTGVDLVVAVDVSRSMLARDVAPSRLERARLAVADLVAQAAGDRIGLVAFAGTAFLQTPLTLDHAAVLESLSALEPSILPRGGTNLEALLREATAAFSSSGERERVLIVLSDGGATEGNPGEAMRIARAGKLRVLALGVGTPQGELIPVPAAQGGEEFVRDAQGRFVKSRLEEDALRKLAEATGGRYERLGPDGDGWALLYRKAVEPLRQEVGQEGVRRVPVDRYAWPLSAALALLVAEPLLARRRRRLGTAAAAWIFAWLVFAPADADASAVRQARQAEAAADPAAAARAWAEAEKEDPEDARLPYNAGVAAYRSGDFTAAAQAFERALRTHDWKLQRDAAYNQGNAQARRAQELEAQDPEAAVQQWESAIRAYESARQIDPEDADAAHNFNWAKQSLEALRKKMQSSPQKPSAAPQQGGDQSGDPGTAPEAPPPSPPRDKSEPQSAGQPPAPERQENAGDPESGAAQHKPEAPATAQAQQSEEDAQKRAQTQERPPADSGDHAATRDAAEGARAAEKPGGGIRSGSGKMSEEEARILLESEADGAKPLPLHPRQPRGQDEPERDW